MTALAVNEIRTGSCLPRISKGKLVVFKEPLQYTGDPTSLPPLPEYTVHGIVRTQWGEDEDMDRMGFKGEFYKYRNNFDSCHPVTEEPEDLKYEGYMYPKPMHHDLTVLRRSTSNTSRRVPRDPKCEMFPRNDTHRASLNDWKPVLSEATRKAIEENVTRLYRNTRYDMQFKDTTRFMVDKAKRDAEYHLENPDYNKTPTCSRVHNHPDPCHHCWYGGFNKDFEAKLANFQSRLHTSTEIPPSIYHGNAAIPLKIDDLANAQKSHCFVRPCQQEKECDCLNHSCGICCQKEVSIGPEKNSEKCRCCNGEVYDNSEAILLETRGIENCEDFGPWQEHSKTSKGVDDSLVQTEVYQFKLPSSVHCQSTQNEYASDWENRHNNLNHYKMSVDQWQSLCRANMNILNKDTLKKCPGMQEPTLETVMAILPPQTSQTTWNSWTYRDKNNLRIPCIANVLGSSHKTDAHKRFQLEHPEPIPDLRDHRRYSRRVKFYGFSSAVFR